jgi:hypothetical protein
MQKRRGGAASVKAALPGSVRPKVVFRRIYHPYGREHGRESWKDANFIALVAGAITGSGTKGTLH